MAFARNAYGCHQRNQVLLSAYQAEFGRIAGGGINLVTRSGGTEVHGSAFWNRRHESMNANSFFNNGYVNPAPGYQLTANFLASPTLTIVAATPFSASTGPPPA
jgi:hypothetical protein